MPSKKNWIVYVIKHPLILYLLLKNYSYNVAGTQRVERKLFISSGLTAKAFPAIKTASVLYLYCYCGRWPAGTSLFLPQSSTLLSLLPGKRARKEGPFQCLTSSKGRSSGSVSVYRTMGKFQLSAVVFETQKLYMKVNEPLGKDSRKLEFFYIGVLKKINGSK